MAHLCHLTYYKSTTNRAQVAPGSSAGDDNGDVRVRTDDEIRRCSYPTISPGVNDSGSDRIDLGLSEKVKALAALIGRRGYVTFAEIKERVGISMHEAITLKPALEEYMRLDIMSLAILDPPGFFMER